MKNSKSFLGGILLLATASMSGAQNESMLPVYVISDGDQLVFQKEAAFEIDKDMNGNPAFFVQLSDVDILLFSDFTGRKIGEYVQVYVCKNLVTEAVIQTRLPTGVIFIMGQEGVGAVTGYLENGCP